MTSTGKFFFASEEDAQCLIFYFLGSAKDEDGKKGPPQILSNSLCISCTHSHVFFYDRHWAWNIFEAMEKYSKVSTGGYSSIHDIRRADNVRFSDKMETFFLAETLKYFYLLFGSDDVLPLDKYVFNTEAHPLPIFTPSDELLARTAAYRSSSSANPEDNDKNEDSAELSAEEKRYKDLISKEDDQEAVADEDDNDIESEEQEASADEDVDPVEDVEDDAAGTDDSLISDEKEKTNDTGLLEDEDEEGDDGVDEVDQGLEDLALDTGEDEEAEVPEVEVDYEDNANEGEADEDTEEDGEEDDEDDGGDGELGSEQDVDEEEEEDEEPEEEEEEEDDFSTDNVGEDFGVVKSEDWENKDGEEEEEEPSYNDHGLL